MGKPAIKLTAEGGDPTKVHVIPCDDLVEHEETDGCVCGPDVQFEPGGYIAIHHSLDRREGRERGL